MWRGWEGWFSALLSVADGGGLLDAILQAHRDVENRWLYFGARPRVRTISLPKSPAHVMAPRPYPSSPGLPFCLLFGLLLSLAGCERTPESLSKDASVRLGESGEITPSPA